MPTQNRIKHLYQKYIDRTCSDVELQELFDLLKEEDQYGAVRTVLRQNWTEKDNLEEFSSLDWATFLKKTGQQKGPEVKPITRKKKWILPLSAAASLLLILGVAAWFWIQREVIITYETGYGEVKEIVLNDNSHVKLNANSKLYWNENWKHSSARKAKIEGEAFFDVAHHNGDQFFVETKDLTVKVTGTKFNVTSRRDETQVFLESGKVFLQLHSRGEIASESTDTKEKQEHILEMIPGDQVSYSSATEEVNQQNHLTIEQAASWKNGSLIFKNLPLKTVLQELSDVYGKSFVVRDSDLFEKKVDAAYPYSDWETVKGLIKLTLNAELTENGNKVIIE